VLPTVELTAPREFPARPRALVEDEALSGQSAERICRLYPFDWRLGWGKHPTIGDAEQEASMRPRRARLGWRYSEVNIEREKALLQCGRGARLG
jgi:hypothetical protein